MCKTGALPDELIVLGVREESLSTLSPDGSPPSFDTWRGMETPQAFTPVKPRRETTSKLIAPLECYSIAQLFYFGAGIDPF